MLLWRGSPREAVLLSRPVDLSSFTHGRTSFSGFDHMSSSSVFVETNEVGVLSEASPADHELILSD